MWQKFIKFILFTLSALFFVSLITFLLVKASSNNPAESYLRASKIPITPEAIDSATEFLGLHKSLPEQYIDWLVKVCQGDFGQSYLFRDAALPLVIRSFLSTLQLGIVSLVIVVIISIIIGLCSAVYKDSLFDKIARLLTYISVSVPTFFIGYVLMIIFGVYFKILPISGKEAPFSIILPSVTLAIPLIGQYAAMIRRQAIEQLASEHVTNAKLRGVNMFYILKNHVLCNMLPVLLSGFLLTFNYLLTGALIIEEVFAWRGIGAVFVEAVQAIDIPVIQTCMLLFAVIFLTSNALMQGVWIWTNPRAREV